jgi:long-subunit acyl-CoA synthetase (AMP-forming)
VPSLLQHVADANPDVVAMRQKDLATGEWKIWTYQQLDEEVQTVAKSLLEIGLHRHHSVAIIGSNAPHWIIANLAAISAG